MRRSIVAMVLVGALAGAPPAVSAASSGVEDPDPTISVMSRNIYLGADVAVALDLLPDMPAAAQFMWEQVADTDFTSRAPVLAAELARERPDVVALQEATIWRCRSSIVGSSTVVFDFTAQLLDAASDAGVEYVIASRDGDDAYNPGYSIPVLPFLTTVRDPQTFQPIFGTDEAACGFSIADALLVRSDLADRVVDVGVGDYDATYAVLPVVFAVDRGYAWADLRTGGGVVRFLTTHLESVWNEGAVPFSSQQARELIEVTSGWTMPLVVVGDFNSDPRDPRPLGAPNPGLQPDTSTGCAAQVPDPSADIADAACNAYWAMIEAGFADAGPDSLDPANATWGASALLAGPDLKRLAAAQGNPYGYTDRLDYVFTKNGPEVEQASLIADTWPQGPDMWRCTSAEQDENAQRAAAAMGVELGEAFCLPTDHVGLLVTVDVPGAAFATAQVNSEDRTIAFAVGGAIVLVTSGLVSLWAIRRSQPLR